MKNTQINHHFRLLLEWMKVNMVGLLATRELSTPFQIALQSFTSTTHFEQTSSLVLFHNTRLRSSQNSWGCFGLDRAIVRVRLRVGELFFVNNEPVKQMLKIMLSMLELLSQEAKELLLNPSDYTVILSVRPTCRFIGTIMQVQCV